MSKDLPPEVVTAAGKRSVRPRFILARRKLWISLLLVIGVGVICAEIGLRLLNPPLFDYTHAGLVSHFYQPSGQPRLTPDRNTAFRLHRKDGSRLYQFRLIVDGFGLRSTGRADQRERDYLGERREVVHCLGDGLTLGWGVDADDSWPELLQRRLGRAYHVVNVAADGYGLIASVRESERVSSVFPPDVIIWAVGVDDFADDRATLAIQRRSGLTHLWGRCVMKLQRVSYLVSSARVFSTWRELADVREVSAIGYEGSAAGWEAGAFVERARSRALPEAPTLDKLRALIDRCDEQGVRLHVVITDDSAASAAVVRVCAERGAAVAVTVLPMGSAMRLPADVFFTPEGNRRLAGRIYDDAFKSRTLAADPDATGD